MRTALAALVLSLAASASHAELPNFAAVDNLHEQARLSIAQGRYEALLADVDKALASKARIPDGRWQLALLLGGVRRGLRSEAHSEADWARYDTTLQALARKHPTSSNAWLLLAVMEDSHAWALRGGGYSDTVTDAGAAGFARHLAKARALLEAHPMPSNPAWFALHLSVDTGLGTDRRMLDLLFTDALKHEPDYQQTWFERMNGLLPKWGGSQEDMVALLLQAAQSTSSERRGMMTRLMEFAVASGYPEVLRWSTPDWADMKTSFDDELAVFPDDANAQWFFIVACSRGDRAEAKHLLEFVKQPPSPQLFGAAGFSFEMASAWASGHAPSFLMVDPQTGQPRRVR